MEGENPNPNQSENSPTKEQDPTFIPPLEMIITEFPNLSPLKQKTPNQNPETKPKPRLLLVFQMSLIELRLGRNERPRKVLKSRWRKRMHYLRGRTLSTRINPRGKKTKRCWKNKLKGYGATLATMFEDLGVKLVDFYGIMKEKRENIINGDTLRGLSLEVMKGRCEKYEAKKDKAKKESPQPTESVGKSRRLTTGTQVKTRLSEPLEISDKDEGTEELVSELANRVMQVEGQLMEMTGKVRSLERTIQNQEKEFQKKLSTMEAKMLKMKEDNKTTLEQILKTLDD
ncbi:uncharacterized protein LOC110690425 isoform X3 [Chenopodium quinoa]|uniref:uncharacterized protein LOC110690425 isoform X3 n=1 Tax=Chenopodium quinoa TaxID=63459 RepID=UPI000B779ECF|nr:uncharacterized protein LOC110690425 isoform X3 [Chenopodium quinoa]